jgi:hypothetical protein
MTWIAAFILTVIVDVSVIALLLTFAVTNGTLNVLGPEAMTEVLDRLASLGMVFVVLLNLMALLLAQWANREERRRLLTLEAEVRQRLADLVGASHGQR